MKLLAIGSMLLVLVAITAGISYSQGYGYGPGYGTGPGYGMGPGMMGGGYGYGPGYGTGPGYGMGPGMMGGYGPGPRGYGQGNQNEVCQKFFDETAELRKELHNKRFEYSEALRNPRAASESIAKEEKAIRDLQEKIYAKNPQGCWW